MYEDKKGWLIQLVKLHFGDGVALSIISFRTMQLPSYITMSFKYIVSIIQQTMNDNYAKNIVVHILGNYSIYCRVISGRDFFERESLDPKCIYIKKTV